MKDLPLVAVGIVIVAFINSVDTANDTAFAGYVTSNNAFNAALSALCLKNDIVNFRGNYYHLRAINDYSLKTGECQLQLLGPIIADSFDAAIANTPVTNPCCTPTLNSVIQSGGSINLSFTLGTGGTCSNCVATTIQTSTDNINWSGNNTAGCTSPRTLSVPSVPTYYRIITNCDGSTTSDPSNSILFTP